MIYNECGHAVIISQGEIFPINENMSDDIRNNCRMIDKLSDEIVANNKELKKIKSFDLRSLKKIKRNLQIIKIINTVTMTLMTTGVLSGYVTILYGIIKRKFIPALVSVGMVILGFAGQIVFCKKTGQEEPLKEDFKKEVDKLLTIIENDTNNSLELSNEFSSQIKQLKKLKSDLEKIKIKQSGINDNIDKEVAKYVKQYGLDKKLAKYLRDENDYMDEYDSYTDDDILEQNNDEPDYGSLIGVVLSSEESNGIVTAECIMYGRKMDGMYVGEHNKQYGYFCTSTGQRFYICLDGKSAYDYREEDYIDDNDSSNGNGKYRFNFDLHGTDIKLTKGSIFFFTYGF